MKFDNLFEAAAKEFEAAFTRSAQGMRPDEIGAPREEHLRRFLSDWLPPQYGITNGYVISRKKEISRQCDVVLYSKYTSPKFILDSKTDCRLVPFADTFGIIEVKSTLGKVELTDSLEKIKSVDKLYGESYREYASHREYSDEEDVELAEIEKDEYSTRRIREDDWQKYKLRTKEKEKRRTPPFSVIFAYQLQSNLNLVDIEHILQKEKYLPNAIIVLNSGLLFHCTRETMALYKAIKTGSKKEDHVWDQDVMFAGFPKSYEDECQTSRYTREECSINNVNLMFFYALVLDLLKAQILVPYAHTDLISVWRK
jgi:hypothetical protein